MKAAFPCVPEARAGSEAEPQACDWELVTVPGFRALWCSQDPQADAQRGIESEETPMQAHGSVLPLSSNYLDQCVLRFRRDAEYLLSRYSTHLLWGVESYFLAPLI